MALLIENIKNRKVDRRLFVIKEGEEENIFEAYFVHEPLSDDNIE